MRPVLALAALGVLVVGSLAACSDDDPIRLADGDHASFSLRPQLNSFGPSEMLPINLIRLTVVSLPDSVQLMDPVEQTVSSEDPSWNLHLDVPLLGGEPVEVIVLVELINVTDGVRTVEWSGVAGPFDLEPGETSEPPEVDLFRGSLDNLSITAVSIDVVIDGDLLEGDSIVMRGLAEGATGVPQLFWSSLAPTVADVDTAAGDSAVIRAVLPGVARIVVEAGQHADTFQIAVAARVTDLSVDPALDTLDALDAQALFTATALDARGDPVTGAAIDWVSSDSLIARSLGGGAFRALANGSVIVTASTPSAPGLTRTASLTVRQLADSLLVTPASHTLVDGTTQAFAAAVFDANGHPMPTAPVTWSSDDGNVASVDPSGLVTAQSIGSTTIRATSGAAQRGATVTVVAGAAASLVLTDHDVSFSALNSFLTLTAAVSDAQGNPVSATVTWVSRDPAVASVTPNGAASARVDAEGNGATYVVASVGGAADSALVQVSQVAESMDVTIDATTVIAGSSTDAHATVYDLGGDSMPASVSWSSSDDAIATVDAAGVVSALHTGSAWIHATYSPAIHDSVQVTVVAGVAATMEIVAGDGQSGTVGAALDTRLIVRVLDGSANPVQGVDVTWSGDGSFAPVTVATNANGRAATDWTLGTVAGAQGATATAGALTATFSATAEAGPVATVDVEPDSLSFSVIGETATLTATPFDAFGNDCGCAATWTSRDAAVATVDGNGLVTAAGNGATWIVADISGVLDSAFVDVSAGGRFVSWLGGTSGAETDWHTGSNWSTGVVPGATDSVHVSSDVSFLPVLSSGTDIAWYASEPGATLTLNGAVTLMVHGDALAIGSIAGPDGGTVMLDADGSAIGGTFPTLAVAGDVTQSSAVDATNVFVNAGVLTPAGQGLVVSDRLEVVGGTLAMTDPGDFVQVHGPALFVDGQPAGTLTAGIFYAFGDLTNVGACGEFVVTGTWFILSADGTSHVALDCPSALFDGNRFDHLLTIGEADQDIFFDTHIIANRFSASAAGGIVTLHGAATTLTARVVEINDMTVDGLQVKQSTASDSDGLDIAGVTFTGFTGQSLTQLEINRPGDSPIFVQADFDASSDGLYIDATDSDGAAPFVEVHVQSANTDGPGRTAMAGGAQVWWTGQPYYVSAVDGDDQVAPEFTALTDSLRVEVLDVFSAPVPGVTIDWSIVDGGGSVNPTTVTSDALGQGTTEWTLGNAFQPQLARASVAGAPTTATFEATSFAGAPGATVSWTGSVSSDWQQPQNWSTGIVPTPADTAFIPFAASTQPVLSGSAAVGGVILDPGASIDLGGNLLEITSYAQSAGVVAGAGLVQFTNDVELRGGTWPNVQVFGETYVWERATFDGFLDVSNDTYLEMTTAPLEVTGDVIVHGDNSMLFAFDSLIVHGNLQVGGAETTGEAYLQNQAVVSVDGDFLVTGRGLFETPTDHSVLRIGGDATWEGVLTGQNLLEEGTIEVAGDWTVDGPSFQTRGDELFLFFNGTGAAQQVSVSTALDIGYGNFGFVHVTNPAGVEFLTPVLIKETLTSDAGVPIVADALVVEHDIALSGDLTAVAIEASDVSVSGALTATSLTASAVSFAAGFAVDSTTYRSPDIELRTATVNALLPYRTLAIEADSAVFDGPASIADRLRVGGVTTLGGRTTVGGQVFVENLGELLLAGYTLDATGGAVSVGESSGSGIIPMTSATDSIIAEQVSFFGSSSEGRMTAGTIVTTGFSANGVAFNADAGHTVVLDPRGGVVTNHISTTGAILADGFGHFGTLHIVGSAISGVEIDTDVAALNFVSDPGVLLIAAPGAQHAVMSDETHVDGTTFRNVPLQVLGNTAPLAIDNSTFEAFDAGSTQLEITHDATQSFLFSNMQFDSIADTDPPADLYLRASKTGLIDDILDIEIAANNIDNGERRTVENTGTSVVWTNDATQVPPPATIAWTGGTSNDWFEPSNWTGNRVPGDADIVHVFGDAPNMPVLFTADTISGLYLAPSATVEVQDSLVVFGAVEAGNTVNGSGTVHVIGDGTTPISGVYTHVIAQDVLLGSAGVGATITGHLAIRGGGATIVEPLALSGNLFLESGQLNVAADAVVAMDLVATGTLAEPAIVSMTTPAVLTVQGSMAIEDFAQLVMTDPGALIDVAGSATFENVVPAAGTMSAGELRIGGDLFAGPTTLQSTGTLVTLDGAIDQHIEMQVSGALGNHLHDLAIEKAGGIVYLDSHVWLGGNLTENAGYPLLDTAQTYILHVDGDVDVAGDLSVDILELGGSLNVGTSLTARVTEFFGSGQVIPSSYGLQSVVVSGTGAVWPAPGLISGALFATGDLTLAADIEVLGATTIATALGSLNLGGHVATLDSIEIFDGPGVVLDQPGAELHVLGSASFQGGTSTLTEGTLFVEAGASLSTVGDAFVATGTTVHMRGALLDMSDAGPGPDQGRLADLVLETPGLLIDTAYVSGSVSEAAPSLVGDAGNPGPWRGLLAVAADIVTPNTGYGLLHIAVGGDLQIDANAMDVDTVEFTGNGQVVRVEDPTDFSNIPYSTILITGPHVFLGDGSEYLNLDADVVVRGPGVVADIISNDDGTIGSLLMEDGDAAQLVRLAGFGWEVQDSIVIESGVLDPLDQQVDVNTSTSAATAFRTTGSGALQMLDPASQLNAFAGDVRFGGGSTDALLAAGSINVMDAGGTFSSVNDAFRATGTLLIMQGDTLEMINSGPNPGQGQLAGLSINGSAIEVTDSLYITGDLGDGRSGGSMLHNATDDALVTVLGNVSLNDTQIIIDHFAIGGSFNIDGGTNWVVDTTEFRGTNQAAPAWSTDNTTISYNVVLLTGSNIDFGHDGSTSQIIFLPTSEVILRGPGSSANIHNNDGPATIGSLRLEGGDFSQLLTLMASLQVYDSVHVESGRIDFNDRGLDVNANGVVANGLTVTGSGMLLMDDTFDALDVVHGPAEFTSSVASVLTGGSIHFGGDFLSVDDAFQADVAVTFSDPQADGSRITMVNGGPAADQGRFADVHFDLSDVALGGQIYLTGDMDDFADGTLQITSAPLTSLELEALDLTSGSDLTLPLLTVHDSISSFFGSLYDVDVTEYAGSGQLVSRTLFFDTLLVTGTATRNVEIGVTDSVARVVLVENGGVLTFGGGTGTQMLITDSLVVDGFGSAFDLGGTNIIIGAGSGGGLVTRNSGVIISQVFGYLQLNGNADFRGGSTEDRLTSGLFYFGGDFYAENGAFQANRGHESYFTGNAGVSSISMPDAGRADGSDHFGDLTIAAGIPLTILSDVYAWGDLDDGGDPFTPIQGTGQTIHADGWQLSSGISVEDVTLELDDSLDPLTAGSTQFTDIQFLGFPSGNTRVRVRHPGLLGGATIQWDNIDFSASESDPGLLVHAIDSDAGGDALDVLFYFASVPEPAGFLSRTLEEDGANIRSNTP